MKSRRIVILCFTVMFGLLVAFALASCGAEVLQPNFSHQGRLLTSGGAVVPDGNYNIRYRLFHAATTGSPVYTETKTVPVSGGLFDTDIGVGSTNYITPEIFAQPVWLEVTVNGEVLTPRERLEGAPFASSLVAGAVIRGGVPLTRTVTTPYETYEDVGAALSVVNTDFSSKGGSGLVTVNEGSETGADRGKVAALQAISANGDGNTATGGRGAMVRSDNYTGLYAQAYTGYYAGYFIGDIWVSGNCIGCAMAYIAQNNGLEAIQAGDFVTAESVALHPDLNSPIMQVHRATAVDGVIGVAVGAIGYTPVEDFNGWQIGGFEGQTKDPAANGQYVTIVVQGLVQAKLGQATGLKIGDWITMSDGQMLAAVGEAPKVARLMSDADENGMAWVMLTGQ